MSDRPTPPKLLLPLHFVSRDANGNELDVRRKIGRPRTVRPVPTADEAEYVEAINRLRDAHVAASSLVTAQSSESTLHEVLVALAEEQASISWSIRHGCQEPRAIEIARSRRVDGLHKIASTILGMRRVGIEAPLDVVKLQTLKTFWLSTVANVARATLPKVTAEEFLRTYCERLDAGTCNPALSDPVTPGGCR